MREFTPEEKKLIVNTEITESCFDFEEDRENRICLPDWEGSDAYTSPIGYLYHHIAWHCEALRQAYVSLKDEIYFNALVRLLPNSYKVVNLCAEQEKKDFCKYKHKVSGKKCLLTLSVRRAMLFRVMRCILATSATVSRCEVKL